MSPLIDLATGGISIAGTIAWYAISTVINCYLNNTVVIDVSKRQKSSYDNKKCPKQIQVDDVTTTGPYNNANFNGIYKIYKHTSIGITNTFKVSGFSGPDGTLLKIGTTPNQPIKNVTEVVVYLSNKFPPDGPPEDTPLLIYYKTTTGTPTHHWYKNTGGGRWVKVEDESLKSQHPTTVASNETIKTVLKEVVQKLSSECQEAYQPTEQGGQSSGETDGLTGQATNANVVTDTEKTEDPLQEDPDVPSFRSP